ncbi:MAG TPA: SDR family oxidoreductase [Acetobacteraceae bacterium]|jgi:NAD(P)-dependent dehydrogenase (short-subunit alcohol dehydrogenase family)|nr:SDR family oxidoreductase [Acetobacteraceae bacterium]
MLLEHRAALVTGGAGRLGRVIAATLRREGAAVAIADCDAGRIASVLPALQGGNGPRVVGLLTDVTDPTAVARLVDEAETAIGRFDVLVNVHGYVPNCPLLDVEVEEWDRTYDVNVKGTMLTCQAVARHWVRDGVQGSIVNLSSGAGFSARPGGAHYCGSKAAVNMLTEVLATELGPHGIRVNAVAPGLVMDEVLTTPSPNQHEYVNLMLRSTPLGRTGAAQDVAEAIAFLASAHSGWTTGSVLQVTGGSHCGRTHMPDTRTMKN